MQRFGQGCLAECKSQCPLPSECCIVKMCKEGWVTRILSHYLTDNCGSDYYYDHMQGLQLALTEKWESNP
eukprot:12443184-Ditylum_brightwellii.AAC.1